MRFFKCKRDSFELVYKFEIDFKEKLKLSLLFYTRLLTFMFTFKRRWTVEDTNSLSNGNNFLLKIISF